MRNRLLKGLLKTRDSLLSHIGKKENRFEEVEEALIQADIGVKTAELIIEKLKREKIKEEIKENLKKEILSLFPSFQRDLITSPSSPTVILMVGVNGVGKTTTIGKLAYELKRKGKKVLLSASDTFRAAAMEQLSIISKKVGVEMVKHKYGADPAAVAFDALQKTMAKKCDYLIIDTAGRMHSNRNLMEELKKIKRILSTKFNYSPLPPPHEILIVLDSHVGQNSFHQTKAFHEALNITGIVLTKLDGTAKGGIILQIEREFGIPVKFVGVGENLEDLVKFSPEDFVESLFYERN